MPLQKVTEKDIDILARTLWAEARGEGLAGMIAAGWTIRNRVDLDLHNDGKADWWGEGYTAVCTKAWQYSCWNKNDPNYAFVSGAKAIPAGEFRQAKLAAETVIGSAADTDPTQGATHYYSTTMPKPPVWADPKISTRTVKIGRHIFFTNVK